MLWPAEYLNEVYENIRSVALEGGCTVIIYVALDCDALCACRILTSLLKSDNVSYKMKAVRFKQDILDDFMEQAQDDIKSIVMLNCGWDIDIEATFSLDESTFCYIIDSHRPFHHMNLLASSTQTIVLADEFLDSKRLKTIVEHIGETSQEEIEEAFASDSEDEDEDEGSDENDSDSNDSDEENGQVEQEANVESEVQDNSMGKKKKKKLRKKRQSQDDESDEESEKELEGLSDKESGTQRKRQKVSADEADIGFTKEEQEQMEKELSQMQSEELRRKRSQSTTSASSDGSTKTKSTAVSTRDQSSKRQVIQQYYSGTSWGSPASHVVFSMAQQINKDNKQHLWLAIIGMTFHYLQNHLEEDDYLSFVANYQDLVKDRTRASSSRFTSEDNIRIPVVDHDKIEFTEEFRLMFFRHWSLKDSFFFSEFIASKLGTWRTDGEYKLNTFFAKMGISRKEAEQTFSFMSMKLKKELRDKIEEHGEEFDIGDDFVYGSFQFRAGYNNQLSAADAVHIVSGLLENFAVSTDTVLERTKSSGYGETPLDKENNEANVSSQTAEKVSSRAASIWQESFNNAYDMLDFSVCDKNQQLFDSGLDMAKSMQQAIIEEGASIISGQRISSAGDFRFCILDGLAPKLASLFTQPQVLLKLANFIMLAHTCSGRWRGASAKPLVVGLKSTGNNQVHFVGIPATVMGQVKRNPFGRQFLAAAKLIDVPCYPHGYDSASVSVQVDDLQRFLLALHEVVSRET